MPYGLSDKNVKSIINVFRANPRIKEVVLFGSRAMGNYKKASDIDLALKGNEITFDDILTIQSVLDELPLAYKFDVLDYNTINNSDLIRHIDEFSVIFYSKPEQINWKIYSLGDILGKQGYIRGPFGSALKRGEMKNIGIPVYEQQHAIYSTRDFRFFIDASKFEELRRFQVRANDLIISCSGTIGRISIIREEDPKGIISQALLILRPDVRVVLPVFLKYFFETPYGHNQLIQASHGSVQTNIASRKIVEAIDMNLPDIPEQSRIAAILSSLDDKIELNLQMNQTLEDMAQAIFKEWFVKFNFPGFDGELVDGLPIGWEKYKITELVDSISVTHSFNSDKVIFLNTSDILDGEFLSHSYSKVAELPGQAKKSIAKDDILLSEIRPANKRYAFVDFDSQDYVVSTKLMVLRSKGIVDNLIVYFFLKSSETLNQLQLLAESRSGTFPQITYSELSKIEMVVPSKKILDIYSTFLKSIFSMIKGNQKQNGYLAEIRDNLLPKLMSGKITVPA